MPTAIWLGTASFYRHADHLGTSPLATTPNRTLYAPVTPDRDALP